MKGYKKRLTDWEARKAILACAHHIFTLFANMVHFIFPSQSVNLVPYTITTFHSYIPPTFSKRQFFIILFLMFQFV